MSQAKTSDRRGTPSAAKTQLPSELFRRRPLTDRPRERLLFLGPQQLNDDELVALVLGSGAALQLARRILDDAGGPTGLRRSGAHTLCSVRGMGPARVCQLKAALELGRRALQPEPLSGLQVSSAADVAGLLRLELSQGEQEAVHVFGLDARHRIRCRHIAAIGQVDRVTVSIADIYRPLVREGMAAALVAHNHPSGEATPSPQDRELTLRMSHIGHLLGISLLDHVIVANGGHYSFAEHGLLSAAMMLPPSLSDGPLAHPEGILRTNPASAPTSVVKRSSRSEKYHPQKVFRSPRPVQRTSP